MIVTYISLSTLQFQTSSPIISFSLFLILYSPIISQVILIISRMLQSLFFFKKNSFIIDTLNLHILHALKAHNFCLDSSTTHLFHLKNDSILQHPKFSCLGGIDDWDRLKLGLVMEHEMSMRDMQSQTSLPFLVMITKQCRRFYIPFISQVNM